MKKVAIYRGCFNPIGKHHIDIANQLCEYFDEVYVTPQYAFNDKTLYPSHRLKMCQIAVNNNNNKSVRVCDFEINSKWEGTYRGIFETFCDYLQRDNNKLYMVIGENKIISMDTNRDINGIPECLPIITIPREGYDTRNILWAKNGRNFVLPNKLSNGSMQEIRAKKVLKSIKEFQKIHMNS